MSMAVHNPVLAPRPMVDSKANSTTKENKPVDARLLKKREADRKCQRKIRERAKARVASLEQVVEELKQKDISGQVEALLKKLADKNSEIELLNTKVKSIQAVLSDQSLSEGEPPVNVIDHNDSASIFGGTVDNIDLTQPLLSPYKRESESWEISQSNLADLPMQADDLDMSIKATALNDLNQQFYNMPRNDSQPPSTDLILEDSNPIIPAPPVPCACSEPSPAVGAPRNIWRFANEVLTARFYWPSYVDKLDDPLADDTPVRAVVEGWDSVELRGSVHPSWQVLKKIDQGIFWNCNPRERLAVLHIMHMLFNAHSHPEMTSGLPEPSEESLHSYAINYFTWPGMRERFVQQQHRYCTNEFWKILTGSLRILWPYEFRDCYTRNIETGSYTISPLFRERLRDIRVWTVGPDMVTRWPEFNTDVPVFNSIPPSITRQHQSLKLFESNARRLSQAEKVQHHSGNRGEVTNGLTSPQGQSLDSTSPKSTSSKLSGGPFGQQLQPLMWGSDFPTHADIISESEYLRLQNLDSFAIPYP